MDNNTNMNEKGKNSFGGIKDISLLIRENIKNLKPYSSARHEFTGKASVLLDANENAYGSPLEDNFNRYPDPYQWQLKFEIAKIKGVPAEHIFIGNGSDEVIDLAYRIFCEPSKDNVIVCPPTYGMYEVSAGINDVAIKKVNLLAGFQLDVDGILDAIDEHTKLIFICSPNNPTGNNMNRADVETLLNNFAGIVLIDEAYINYSKQKSFIQELTEYPNLIVMQTLSKAWGLAALRLGICYASLPVIEYYNKVKPPYNINEASQELALEALAHTDQVNHWIKEVVSQRVILTKSFSALPFVEKVYNSDANFLLVKVKDAEAVYKFLTKNEVVVRNRSKDVMCENCLRITIGTPDENEQLLELLQRYKK